MATGLGLGALGLDLFEFAIARGLSVKGWSLRRQFRTLFGRVT